jgi:HK97 family phage portal protein
MILTFEQNLSEEQFNRINSRMNEKHAGGANAGKNLILEGKNATAVAYGYSPTDMNLIEGNRELARRISLGYGVPPQLLGIPGDSTYSNYESARLAFWEETVFFYLNLLKTELNNWLLDSKDNLELDYVLDNTPAMSIKQDKLWERAQNSDFISINEKRELVGKEKVEGGDAILVPISLMPLGEDMEKENYDEVEDETAKNLRGRGKTEEEVNEMMSEDEL